MTLGERIKDYRKARKMTQEELAAACGTIRANICKYEKGTIVNIPPDMVKKLSAALEVSAPKLLGWEEGLTALGYTIAREKHIVTVSDLSCANYATYTEAEYDSLILNNSMECVVADVKAQRRVAVDPKDESDDFIIMNRAMHNLTPEQLAKLKDLTKVMFSDAFED